MDKFDSKTTLNISEGYDLKNQKHYVNKKCGLCDCFHKTCSFRVWKVLVFLLVVAAIMTVMGLLIAMFGPGNADLRYSEKESRVAPTVVKNEGEKHTSSKGTSTTGEPGTGTVEPTKPQSTSRPSESSQCTSPTTPPDEKTPLKCEVAIVGGGTGGLILAYALLKGPNPKETDVCIFEKENRLGGKILDHRFAEAPNVTVGLGEWYRPGLSYGLSDTLSELTIDRLPWKPQVSRVEARGVYAKDFDSLNLKAFPTLSDNPLMSSATIKKTAKDLQNKNANNFSTAGTFLSGYLSPEGAKLMEDVYGFKGGYMQAINPKSYKKYLKETVDEDDTDEDERPPRGMSQMIEQLDLKVRHFNGTIFLQEAVTSISKKGDKFVLLTTNFTVEAKKAVLAVGPTALKKLSGDVIQSIISHDIFKSIVSVPAFSGAAVYPTAWWNDSVAAQKNNSLEPLQQFVSSSHCLGITMPYKGTGPNGTAVLHTVANNGGCSDMWGNILKVSKDAVDREMKRALEYKFQRTIPVEPLATVYKYWEEGYWYFQKPGSSFSLTEIKDWAKRPLTGNDVFLVGRAFHNFGGWLEDTIRSADEALNEGWKFRMSWL